MATLLIAPGAWSGAWHWKKMRPLLEARGHRMWTATYTGTGERSHLAHPDIDLESHIADVLNILDYEDLNDVTLIGHSYGGMVATGVADRAPARISMLVYLDAFVPGNGQSLFALHLREWQERMRERARLEGDGWRLPPIPMPSDTLPEDVSWATPRRGTHPIRTFEQPLRLAGAVEHMPRIYIYCKQPRPGDVFRPFFERARQDSAWRAFEIDATHNPHVTAPEVLADLLDEIVTGRTQTPLPT